MTRSETVELESEAKKRECEAKSESCRGRHKKCSDDAVIRLFFMFPQGREPGSTLKRAREFALAQNSERAQKALSAD